MKHFNITSIARINIKYFEFFLIKLNIKNLIKNSILSTFYTEMSLVINYIILFLSSFIKKDCAELFLNLNVKQKQLIFIFK